MYSLHNLPFGIVMLNRLRPGRLMYESVAKQLTKVDVRDCVRNKTTGLLVAIAATPGSGKENTKAE